MAYLVHEGSNVPFRSRSFFLGPCGEATFSYCHPFGRGAARSLVPPPPGLSSIKIRYDCWVSYLISHPTAASTGEQSS